MAERKRFLLRLDPGLWEDIQRMAAREFRSANAQIEYLLEAAVRERLAVKRGRGGGSATQESDSGSTRSG